MHDEWVDAFVLCGTEEECRAEVNELVAHHGIDEFQVPVNDLDTATEDLALAASVIRSQN